MDPVCVKVSAPGKVILHGEHSVVFGKTAVAVSLGLRTTVYIKETSNTFINIDLPSVQIKEKLPLQFINKELLSHTTIKDPESLSHEDHLSKVETIVKRAFPHFDNLKGTQKNALTAFFYIVCAFFGGNQLDKAFDIRFLSDLTVGAGTGSSASFSVCLAAGILQLVRSKSGMATKVLSFEDKKLITKWAFNCERIMHGTPSGIDNTTATFGSLVSFRKGQEPELLDLKLDLRILLVDTRVSRQTQELARKVRVLIDRNREAVECVMDAIDHISKSALKILQNLSSGNFEGEIDTQYENLAELWNMNHCLLASLGVSHPALESIRASAAQHGLASKLTGAGGGGYAIVLVPPSTNQSVVETLTQELTAKGFKVTDTTLGGPGVSLDS